MPTHVPVFVLTVGLLAMLPGAGQALMTRQTLQGGRHSAYATIGGTATGLLIWSSAAAAGLSAVLLTNPAAYAAVRIAGGIVLLVLGVNTLLALRGSAPEATGATTSAARIESGGRIGHRSGYGAGLATNLGNPKAGVFAISVLPQFVTAHGPVLLSSILLGVIWASVTVCWYLLFTWAVDRGRVLVSRPSVHRALQLTTGTVLLLLGLAVASGI